MSGQRRLGYGRRRRKLHCEIGCSCRSQVGLTSLVREKEAPHNKIFRQRETPAQARDPAAPPRRHAPSGPRPPTPTHNPHRTHPHPTTPPHHPPPAVTTRPPLKRGRAGHCFITWRWGASIGEPFVGIEEKRLIERVETRSERRCARRSAKRAARVALRRTAPCAQKTRGEGLLSKVDPIPLLP